MPEDDDKFLWSRFDPPQPGLKTHRLRGRIGLMERGGELGLIWCLALGV